MQFVIYNKRMNRCGRGVRGVSVVVGGGGRLDGGEGPVRVPLQSNFKRCCFAGSLSPCSPRGLAADCAASINHRECTLMSPSERAPLTQSGKVNHIHISRGPVRGSQNDNQTHITGHDPSCLRTARLVSRSSGEGGDAAHECGFSARR